MKKLTLLFLLFSALTARGQDYIPMAVEDATWVILEYEEWGDPSHYSVFKISGDTLINDTAYKKVYRRRYQQWTGPIFGSFMVLVEENYGFAVRDDNENRKVYAREYGLCGSDGEEILWFNFDLEIGDINPEPSDMCLITDYEVTNVFYQNLYGEIRRTIECWDEGVYCNNYLIEGIGTEYAGIWGGVCFEPVAYLQHFCIGPDSICLQDYLALSVPQPASSQAIVLFPNPAQESVKITLNSGYSMQTATMELHDLYGRLMMQKTISGSEETIDVSEFPSGIYFLILKFKSGKNITQKLFIK